MMDITIQTERSEDWRTLKAWLIARGPLNTISIQEILRFMDSLIEQESESDG